MGGIVDVGDDALPVRSPGGGDFAPDPQARRLRLAEWIGLAVTPLFFFWAYGVQPFFLLSGADPFIYTGYAVRWADLIDRLGYPYYAVRFGLVVPSTVLSETLGILSGYFSLRWFVSVIAAGALFQLLRSRFRWELGALAALMLLLNPIYIRA